MSDASDSRGSWLGRAARAGYAACGTVYVAIGAIAVAVAGDLAERPGGAQHVMRLLVRQPVGQVLLVALGAGFLGYAALNLSGAFFDQERRGRSFAGLMIRSADALTGSLYVALAVAAVRIAAAPSRAGGQLIQQWAGGILALPGGAALLCGIGVSLAGAGGFVVYRARAEPFEDILDRRALSTAMLRALTIAARFGTVARGVILGISGLLVTEAAVTRRPDRVGGIGDALSTIETSAFGAWLLGVIGLGFVAYGMYQLAKVRYRRVPIRWAPIR